MEKRSEVKMHQFVLNVLKSTTKGALQKTKTGLWKMADENKYLYECGKCRTAFETSVYLAGAKNLVELNKEITLRFPCI